MQKQKRLYSAVFIILLVGVILINRGFTHVSQEATKVASNSAAQVIKIPKATKLIRNLWRENKCGQAFAGLSGTTDTNHLPNLFLSFKKKKPPQPNHFTGGLFTSLFSEDILFSFVFFENKERYSENLIAFDSISPRAP